MTRPAPSVKVRAAAALAAGAGTTPRHLASPIVIELDVPGNASDPLAIVSMSWRVHPAITTWADAAGNATHLDLHLIAGPGYAPIASKRRSDRPRLLMVSGRVDVIGPELPPPSLAATTMQGLSAWPKTIIVGTPAWFEHAKALSSSFIAVTGPDPTTVLCGPPLDLHVSTPAGAMRQLESSHLTHRVAADTTSVDLAYLEQAAAAGRPDLSPAQDLAVSQLRATEIGAILAHPPGSGKTVITASALQEDPAGTSVVLAPPAVLLQWVDEINRWAPARTVRLAQRTSDLPSALRPGDVLVASYDVGAQWLTGNGTRVDDLICDEGHVVLSTSQRARSLWAARQQSTRGWLLTGTPRERTALDTAALVAWARACPREAVTPRPIPEFGPVILLPSAATGVPDVEYLISLATPTSSDIEWIDQLAARATAATTPFERARLSDIARRGLAGPAALGKDGPWSKADHVARLISDHAQTSSSTLLCADTLGPLEAMAARCDAAGFPSAVLTPSLSRSARARILAAFDSGDLLVLGVAPASQRGVNLQRSNLVIHLDLPATRAGFEQRNGRAARLGSPHPKVTAVIPAMEGTWDHRWAQAFLAGDTDPLGCL